MTIYLCENEILILGLLIKSELVDLEKSTMMATRMYKIKIMMVWMMGPGSSQKYTFRKNVWYERDFNWTQGTKRLIKVEDERDGQIDDDDKDANCDDMNGGGWLLGWRLCCDYSQWRW